MNRVAATETQHLTLGHTSLQLRVIPVHHLRAAGRQEDGERMRTSRRKGDARELKNKNTSLCEAPSKLLFVCVMDETYSWHITGS